MPKVEPYRAWATFSFTAASGRINECDLLIAVPGGLYLVELKGHPGHVVSNGETWRFSEPDSRLVRTLRNPLHLVDLKSKELKNRLEWAGKQLGVSGRIPRVEPAVFLSAPTLRSQLDEVQQTRVYGRDDIDSGLPWIWRDLLAQPPQRELARITPQFSRVLPRLMEKIGIRASTAHLRFGDDWMLKPEPMDVGPTWEDRLAERKGIVREEGRVRIYLTAQQAIEEAKRSVTRAAQREYQVLQGITHRGIAQALQIQEHHGGPAILFRHKHSDLRLDAYLAVHGEALTPEIRLDMVRQLAEALRYAHNRSLYHRALSARSVYVSGKTDGSTPVLRIIDWQMAARDFDAISLHSIGASSLTGEHLGDAAEIYLAPEFTMPYADPVDLDVFGLGAVSYLILTGQPPAAQRSGLIDRLTIDGGLHPYAVLDGIADALDTLIFRATRADLADRLHSADQFLHELDQYEQDSPAPETVISNLDPLTAIPGQHVDGNWCVERVLGTGATARTLLVTWTGDEEDGEPPRKPRVLKVALDEHKAPRLHAEAQALDTAGGGVVVRLLGGPRELCGRTVLDLEYAGERSLGARLRAEGKLTYHELARFGGDLFTALDHLAAKGVRHRDVKPDNFGVFQRADRSWQLMLFDFSLAGISERDITVGTRGYLDPFLGTDRRPVFDDHAERYAAAITLHEMASGEKPVWGDGMTDPRTTRDETPNIAVELFEPALREGLAGFFQRALHRDVNCRFDTFRQMEDAWRAVFTAADAAAPATTPATVTADTDTLEEIRDAAADSAELDTPLEAAGLSPRAVSVAHTFNATTVGELLDVRLHQIAKARGAGALIRKELNRRHKQWTARLGRPASTQPTLPARSATLGAAPTPRSETAPEPEVTAQLTVDDMAARLTPSAGSRASYKSDVIWLTLGLPRPGDDIESGAALPWPTQATIAQRLGITQASVSRHHQAAIREWAAECWLAEVRNELVELVAAAGRVMTADEVAAAVRVRHGVAADEPLERTMAKVSAVVRAAVEAEIWPDGHATAAGVEPRLAVRRRGQRVLIVLESLPGTDDPSAPELADYAFALGRKADELAGRDPLPGRAVVLRDLRAVTAPEGLSPLADTRLVALAAAVSNQVAASPRLELYPRELDLTRALRISQAAAAVRRDPGITMDELLAKVRARFPDLAVDDRITHVQVEEALQAAGFTLEYQPIDKRFRPPASEPGRLISSSTALSGHGRMAAVGLDPYAVTRQKLADAVERGGFLALSLRGHHLPEAVQALATAYGVLPVDFAREFLAAFRALVAERGQDWSKVLTNDARFTQTGQISPGFASYLRAVWTGVAQRLHDPAVEQKTVLFVHNAGPLARYHDQGGHELLTRLQAAARRPRELPHGLWLLCPAESALDAPNLDGRIVEVLDATERVVLSGRFLAELRGETGTAA
jgi:serine/threonine protein kinase